MFPVTPEKFLGPKDGFEASSLILDPISILSNEKKRDIWWYVFQRWIRCLSTPWNYLLPWLYNFESWKPNLIGDGTGLKALKQNWGSWDFSVSWKGSIRWLRRSLLALKTVLKLLIWFMSQMSDNRVNDKIIDGERFALKILPSITDRIILSAGRSPFNSMITYNI